MRLKYKWVLMCAVCLSFEVVMTVCQVIWVNRNVTDSFRIGEDGCTNGTDVCPSKAECQPDGSCLCDGKNPNFRNPVTVSSNVGGEIMLGDSYGCVDNSIMSFRVTEAGTSPCPFTPFQVIPYSHEGPVTKFSHHDQVINCSLDSLNKSLVKFPDNAMEIELQWLNESYVYLNISKKTMYFKWRRSVPDLQGAIITLNLYCGILTATGSIDYQAMCLQAKILGTWKAGSYNTTSPPSVVITIPVMTGNGTITTLSTTSTGSSPSGEISGGDGDSSGTIIIIAVVIPVVLLIVLVGVIWWLCKRKKGENSLRINVPENSRKTNGSTGQKLFRRTDGNSQTNVGYSTSGNQHVVVQGNAAYETSNVQNNKPRSQEDPGYETPDFKRKEVERVNSYPEPGYESADLKRKEVNAAPSDSTYSIPDKTTGEGNPDVKRVEVNGDLYSLPDKSNKQGNDLNYMDPSYLVSGGSDKTESPKETNEPTEYAQIIGVMRPAEKDLEKKKK